MLDYATPQRRYQRTSEDRAWRLRRFAYYLAQALLFLLIVYRVGPNLFLFHSPFSPSPARYAALTPPYAPLVAALKAYQRDYGSLPLDVSMLPKEYQPADYQGEFGSMYGNPTITFWIGTEHSVLAYDFTPATEGWLIYAPRYRDRIPAPIVQAAPSPATRPAATGAPK